MGPLRLEWVVVGRGGLEGGRVQERALGANGMQGGAHGCKEGLRDAVWCAERGVAWCGVVWCGVARGDKGIRRRR